jgi:hypothetical protein
MATNEAPPATDTEERNPFDLIAYVLFKVRHSLEDVEQPGRPPRWIRIARTREARGSSDYISIGVKKAVDGVAEGLAYLAELTLDIREILVQTDAAKALLEVSLDMIKAFTDDNFVNGLKALIGEEPGANPISGVGTTIDDIKKYLGYIPEPDDVIALGHELYRLLCIEQVPLPRLTSDCAVEEVAAVKATSQIDLAKSGKIRLLQWAFEQGTTTFGLGTKDKPEDEKHDLFRFGSRRIWKQTGGELPVHSVGLWGAEGSQETIFEFFYGSRENDAAKKTLDIEEAHALIEKMGYVEPNITDKKVFSQELIKRLRRFQAVNGLVVTGEMDNATINRLMNLDHGTKNLRRAKPFDAQQLPEDIDKLDDAGAPKCPGGYFKIVNPDADHPQDEKIAVLSKGKYQYYVAGAVRPAT